MVGDRFAHVRFLNHLLREDVRLRLDPRRRPALLQRHGAHHGGLTDRQRLGVLLARVG